MSKKKEKTILTRVEELSKEFSIPEDKEGKFKVAVLELIERAKSPEMFCPKCETRMSLDLEAGKLDCFSCGHKVKLSASPAPASTPRTPVTPTTPVASVAPGGQPDPRILKAIDDGEKPPKKKKGKSILELAGSRGGAGPTDEDAKHIEANVPGAKSSNINWCN